MYARNAASPEPIAIGPVVQITDGAVQTSGCTVRIKPIGVSEGDGGGTTAYSTDGVVIYTPTQAETNYTSFILIAKKTGCIPASITVVTTASATPGTVVVSSNSDKTGYSLTATTGLGNQTADITGNLSGSVGSVTGLAAANLDAAISTRATPAQVNAEMLDVLNVDTFAELSAPPAATSSLRAKLTWVFMWLRNKSTQTSTDRKLYADDGTTVVSTEVITADANTYSKGEAS